MFFFVGKRGEQSLVRSGTTMLTHGSIAGALADGQGFWGLVKIAFQVSVLTLGLVFTKAIAEWFMGKIIQKGGDLRSIPIGNAQPVGQPAGQPAQQPLRPSWGAQPAPGGAAPRSDFTSEFR